MKTRRTRRESGRTLAAVWLALLGGCARPVARIEVHAETPAERQTEPPPAEQESPAPPRAPTLSVTGLRCEHVDEPLALDTRSPRFSWKLAALDATRRGLAQRAYRILVSSSPDELAAEHGDLWDSGRVESNETIDVAYAGRALRSFELAHWMVQVWDQDGGASAWSPTARFGMGVLAPADWRAQWIGFDAPLRAARPVPDLGAASWIRATGAEHEVWFRRRFELIGAIDAQAVLIATAANEAEIFVNGQSLWRGNATPGVRRNAELTPKIARALHAGTNVLAARVRSAADAPAALRCRLLARPLAAADTGELLSDATWRATTNANAVAGFERPDFDDASWPAVTALEPDDPAMPEVDPPAAFLPPPRLLRTTFTARAGLTRAMLFASALGVYSLELNGERTQSDWLAPGWTDYTRRIPYRGYDVTSFLLAGENALGVVLADGWYAGFLGKRGQRNHYGESPRFLGQLVLDYADGTRELVTSDATWKAAVGPWREADLYMGERYDARLEPGAWSAPGFDASAWQPVDVGADVTAPLVAHPGPEIRVVAEGSPLAITERGPGRAIFDFGQNLAGVVRLTLAAPAGTAIVLRYGEALEADGSLMRRNLSWARAVDQYVCKGDAGSEDTTEIWQPRFTYHGFRYVEVSGLPGPATKSMLTALALSSATQPDGELHCSDPTIDRLVENARWTLRANSMDFPTDCPQRGERLGWTGDAQLFAPSALWLADLQTLYDKWSIDLLDAQRPDGRFPSTAPSFPGMANGGAAWEDAGVLVPALLFDVYGDRRLAERHLASMQRYVAAADAAKDAAPEGFGDWHALETTPLDVIQLAYLARSARRTAELARALGRESEAKHASELDAALRRRFAERCVDAEGRVRGESQTGYALALNEGLVPAGLRERAAKLFAANVEKRGTLATGFVGTPELLPALSAIGRGDLAYGLLRNHALPSWGYMLDQGATTVWEQWDAWTPETGFAKDGRPSLDHTPLASFVAWLFENAAGIHAAAPGFASLALAPAPGGGLTWLDARYDSVRGLVAVRWELAAKELHIEVSVPPNVTATLSLPAGDEVREGGLPLASAPGVHELGRLGDALLLGLGSGNYSFVCPAPQSR